VFGVLVARSSCDIWGCEVGLLHRMVYSGVVRCCLSVLAGVFYPGFPGGLFGRVVFVPRVAMVLLGACWG